MFSLFKVINSHQKLELPCEDLDFSLSRVLVIQRSSLSQPLNMYLLDTCCLYSTSLFQGVFKKESECCLIAKVPHGSGREEGSGQALRNKQPLPGAELTNLGLMGGCLSLLQSPVYLLGVTLMTQHP